MKASCCWQVPNELISVRNFFNPPPFQGSPPEAEDAFEAGQPKLGLLFCSAAEHRSGDPVGGSDQVLFNTVGCHLSAVSMRVENWMIQGGLQNIGVAIQLVAGISAVSVQV